MLYWQFVDLIDKISSVKMTVLSDVDTFILKANKWNILFLIGVDGK